MTEQVITNALIPLLTSKAAAVLGFLSPKIFALLAAVIAFTANLAAVSDLGKRG